LLRTQAEIQMAKYTSATDKLVRTASLTKEPVTAKARATVAWRSTARRGICDRGWIEEIGAGRMPFFANAKSVLADPWSVPAKAP